MNAEPIQVSWRTNSTARVWGEEKPIFFFPFSALPGRMPVRTIGCDLQCCHKSLNDGSRHSGRRDLTILKGTRS